MNERNQLNFYGFYNPYSQELDGSSVLQAQTSETILMRTAKKDDDINRSWFNSIWYKHVFNNIPGHELILETNWHRLRADNSTTYANPETGYFVQTTMQPLNRSFHIKLDYNLPVKESAILNAGIQSRFKKLRDNNLESYRYNQEIFAGYGIISYRKSDLEINLGLRVELNIFQNHIKAKSYQSFMLPNASIKYAITTTQSLGLNYRSSLTYPHYFQLNPSQITEDPYTTFIGSPDIHPENIKNLNLEYSNRFENHFFSAQLYLRHISEAIHLLMYSEDGTLLIAKNQNLGDIYQLGVQFSGALSLGKAGLYPYLKVFNARSTPNTMAMKHNIEKRHQMTMESGFGIYRHL